MSHNSKNSLIGVLGGTFDPVHNGHIMIAHCLLQDLPLTNIQLLPCLQPPHRPPPIANNQQRLHMIQVAIKDQINLIANDIDFHRPGPSYMVDTLHLLRNQFSSSQFLCLIIGIDNFIHFNLWHQWQEIFELAHLIIVNRPHFILPHSNWMDKLLSERKINSIAKLISQPAGFILFHNIKPCEISATHIRQKLAQGKEVSAELPPAVLNYIKEHHLYR